MKNHINVGKHAGFEDTTHTHTHHTEVPCMPGNDSITLILNGEQRTAELTPAAPVGDKHWSPCLLQPNDGSSCCGWITLGGSN